MTFKKQIKQILVKHKLYSLHNILYQIYLWYQQLKVIIIYGNRDTYEVNIASETISFDTSKNYAKRWFYLNIKKDSIYEPALSFFLNNNLKPSSCFFDVGAHIGYFSCIAANKLKQGEVHLFEVDINCIKYINKNIAKNNFTNVIINNIAVSDSTDGVFIPNKKSPNNKTNILSKNENGRFVKSTTVDNYVETHQLKPDFIKIDVEAAESKVLKGMLKTFELRPLTLLIEIHANVLEFYGFSYKEILTTLFDYGFTLYELVDFRNNNYEKKIITKSEELSGNTLVIAEKK